MAVVQVIIRYPAEERIMFDEHVTISDDPNTGEADEYAIYSALARAILVHAINRAEKNRPETR